MEPCELQCPFCEVYYHELLRIAWHYEISLIGNQEQESIKVYLPQTLLVELKTLKQKDERSFINALLELLIEKFNHTIV